MITLFQFQETAAASIAARVSDYLDDPVAIIIKKKRHDVPFFQALSALTGSGKTVILAEAVSHIAQTMPVSPVVMWLSKGKVVVEQSFANLSPGGKYHHLLENFAVLALADYSPIEVEESDCAIMYFATVGTFNQKDKSDGTLRIHQSDVDNIQTSVWEALRKRTDAEGNRRPLVVVYDEAHNLSDQQTELLLELEPDGFLLATATMRLPARIGDEVALLRTMGGATNDDLITKVVTADVVSEGLVKSTVDLEGYNTPMEEAVDSLLKDLEQATTEAKAVGVDFTPKAMYVCNTNTVADTPSLMDNPKRPFAQRQAPPILIWRHLVEQRGVDPKTVAVYANLKTDRDFLLPDEFVLFKGGDNDYDDFVSGDYQHVIFNLTLQEGWDDPAVYFAYVDKSMGSKAQITQIIGRVLRQPGAKHYPSDILNTAHFYVRVDKNSVFNEVIGEVKDELGSAPGGIRIVVTPPGKPKPEPYAASQRCEVPETALDATGACAAVESLVTGFPDFRTDTVNTKAEGSRRVFRQKVGEAGGESEWEAYEQASTASARWVFHREVQRQFRAALGVVNLAEPKLDAIVGIGSSAHTQVCLLAGQVVEAYVKGVRIKQRRSSPYVVGAILARPDEVVSFNNAVHDGYAGLNTLERPFAEAVDQTGLTWCRNPPRSGYGIPLTSVGATQAFYPDFLIWTAERVICVDTKGHHLIRETAARKLLRIKHSGEGRRLDVQFVSEGKFDDDLELRDPDGFTYWGLGDDGKVQARHYESLDELVKQLSDDSTNTD